jgi:hypothetical protein
MDVSKILAELKAERAQIEEAISSLERLALGRKRGPGRPRNLTSAGIPGAAGMGALSPEIAVRRRGRPPGSKNKPKPAASASLAASVGTQ